MSSQSLKKNIAFTERLLSTSSVVLKFHLLWCAVVVVSFGLVTGITLTKIVINKASLVKEMEITNKKLQARALKIDEQSRVIDEQKQYLSYLDYYLPTDFQIQNYLTEFFYAVSKAGYRVGKYDGQSEQSTQQESIKTSTFTTTLLSGSDPVLLVTEIERLKKITEITNVQGTNDKNISYVKTSLKVFIGPTQ